jgi:hypothetical protein
VISGQWSVASGQYEPITWLLTTDRAKRGHTKRGHHKEGSGSKRGHSKRDQA